jgi:hypothetical protein
VQAMVQEFRDREAPLHHEIAETEAAVKAAVFATGGERVRGAPPGDAHHVGHAGHGGVERAAPGRAGLPPGGAPSVTIRARRQWTTSQPRGAPRPPAGTPAWMPLMPEAFLTDEKGGAEMSAHPPEGERSPRP